MTNKHKVFDVFVAELVRVVTSKAVFMMYLKSVLRVAYFAKLAGHDGAMSCSHAYRQRRLRFARQRLAYSPYGCVCELENFYDGSAIYVTQERYVSDRVAVLVKLRDFLSFFLRDYLNSAFSVALVRTSCRRIKSVFGDIVFNAAVVASEYFAVLSHGSILTGRRPKCII